MASYRPDKEECSATQAETTATALFIQEAQPRVDLVNIVSLNLDNTFGSYFAMMLLMLLL